MMHSHVLLSLCILLTVTLGLVSSQQCNSTSYGTVAYTFASTNTLKTGAARKLRIGLLGFLTPMDRPIANVICYQLNNNPDILPGVESYLSNASSTSDVLLATLFHINSLKVNGIIAGFSSTDARTAQLAAKVYNLPHTSSLANSYTLSNKEEYPYFLRTYPSDSIQIVSIISLFRKFNWKKAIIVYTFDDYGNAYSRLTTAGADYNISFVSIGVSPDAKNASQVQATVDAVVQAIQQQEYRIIIYYAQYYPSLAIMEELHKKGFGGSDYVKIITTSMGASLNAAYDFYENTIALTSPTPSGAVLDDVHSKWMADPNIPFPKYPKAALSISWFIVDAILNYAYAFDKLMKANTPFENIKGALLYNTLITNEYEGTTGPVVFDELGDRLMSFSVNSLVGNGTRVEAGFYDPLTDEFQQTADFVWANGRTTVPRDSPFRCATCGPHGTCVEDVGCVCQVGYSGEGCFEHHEDNTAFIVGVTVGLGALLAVVIIVAFFVYRRKRYQLVKEVADKQRSKISRSDISMQDRIGRGASGEVFKASFRGTEVAVKKIVTSNADNSVIREFELEVAIMCGLRHPNIILFMGSCFDEENKEMLLVMEFMARGSLHDVLHNPAITLTYEMKLHLALQAAQGMNFLHQSSPPIIHQDLKSHNILLDDKWNARISDFGITKFHDKNQKGKKVEDKGDNAIGTIYWSSPESLEGLETTEKSDCYSFGIVLWEIFHRQNPYEGRDPISVAMEVMFNNMRPPINMDVPNEMQDLMRKCWDKDAVKRPSFQEIVTALRECSMKNPSYAMVGEVNARATAPSGKVYIVNTSVVDAYTAWETCPNDMNDAMVCHNNLIRSNLDMYRGYESKSSDLHSFMIMFNTVEDAVDFCIATQISLLHVDWPAGILNTPSYREVSTSSGTLLWKGLRVKMSVYTGVPNCELDPATGRMLYMGPAVDSSQKLLKKMKRGYICLADSVVDEINKNNTHFIQDISTKKEGDMFDTARNETQAVHSVSIHTLSERDNVAPITEDHAHPHVLVDVSENELQPLNTKGASFSDLDMKKPEWIIPYANLDVKESVGKGAMGDYYRAMWSGKEVAIKVMMNQRMKEEDLLKLMNDSSRMSKMNHPNLLKFYGCCLDKDRVSVIADYMPRGNLKLMLADNSISLTLQQKLKIAMDVAKGLSYLNTHRDEDLKIHCNLKSYNILIGRDLEAKVSDYGLRHLKELARTMTSIGSVAWTAPELLSGDDRANPKITVYSFGIILWEIYTRQVPYVNEHPIRVVSKILAGFRPPIPNNCPAIISELITKCLDAEPEERPTWDVIIASLSDAIRSL